MNYELAKQLKDAGFPETRNCDCAFSQLYGRHYVPTLSELIEACGSEFGELASHSNADLKWMWRATRWNNDQFVGRGATPEEAVANLWLALNTKDHARKN